MFHSLKRATVGNLAARNEPTNTEYEHLRKSLDEISKRLQTNLTQFENVQRKWSHIVEDQETFYLDLINSTNNLQNTQHQLPLHPPPPQDKNTIYHQSADIVYTGVRSGMQNMSKPGGNHTLLILGVRAFITELKAISVECVRVDKARTDFIMYSQKLDKLKNNMYDSSSERYDRNKEKMEKTKVLYDALLHAVLLKMTRCYEKSNFMFQSLFVVYNSYSIGMCHLLSYQLNPINDYCREHEQELVDYMISTNNNPNSIQENNNNNNNSNDVPITNNNNNNNSNNNIYFMNNTNTTDEGNIFTNNQQQPNHGIGMNVHSTQHHQQQPIDPSFYDSPQGVNQHGYGHV